MTRFRSEEYCRENVTGCHCDCHGRAAVVRQEFWSARTCQHCDHAAASCIMCLLLPIGSPATALDDQATLTKPQSGDPRSSNDGGRRLVLSCVGRAAAIRTRDSSCQSACLAHSVKTSAHWGAILTVAYGMNEFRSSKCLVCLCFSLLCVRYAHSVLLTCRAQSHDPIMGGRL